MTAAVLIVNWNSAGHLASCLRALQAQRRKPDRIIVVDNGSTDGSLDLASHWLQHATLIRLNVNVGFAKANNIAAAAVRDVDALALLNPDAEADAGWLEALIAAAETRPDVGCFASRMLMASTPALLDGAGDGYHVSGRAWRIGHRTAARDWPSGDTDVFGPCAAAALYRREAFEEAGGFDEGYFCYFEDVDLAFRLRLRGHACLCVHSAVVRHVGSASTGYRSDFAVYHGERNAVWTFVKNMPAPLFWLYLPQHILLNAVSLLYYPCRGQGRVVLRAKVDALRGLPRALRDRAAIQAGRRVEASALRKTLSRGALAPYLRRYTRRVP